MAKGIKEIKGKFERGSVVNIVDSSGEEFARGIISYSAEEMEKLKGRHSEEFFDILGHKDSDSVIHRDNLILRY